ncbi:MAG: response regulator [Calditrichaeota bacterium]|nr:response regulator [Calditrichota bacterium]
MAKILVVEDSAVDRLVIRRFLADTPHEIREVEHPREVQTTIKQWRPDIILLDIVMPEVNGYEICRNLKRNRETADIPVIFITAKKQKSDIYWGKKQGANEYLIKPIQQDVLLRTIDKWLADKKHVSVDG